MDQRWHNIVQNIQVLPKAVQYPTQWGLVKEGHWGCYDVSEKFRMKQTSSTNIAKIQGESTNNTDQTWKGKRICATSSAGNAESAAAFAAVSKQIKSFR